MNRIRELREEKMLSQKQLEAELQMGRGNLSRYEKENIDLNTDTIRALCRYFGVSADYLLGISSQRHHQISDADARLVQAYHDADDDHKLIVDTALGLHSVRPQNKSEAS